MEQNKGEKLSVIFDRFNIRGFCFSKQKPRIPLQPRPKRLMLLFFSRLKRGGLEGKSRPTTVHTPS